MARWHRSAARTSLALVEQFVHCWQSNATVAACAGEPDGLDWYSGEPDVDEASLGAEESGLAEFAENLQLFDRIAVAADAGTCLAAECMGFVAGSSR